MPFIETYSVNFGNGNLLPSFDPHFWGAMTTSHPLSPEDLLDPLGLTLTVTRDAGAATTLLSSVYIVPPQFKDPITGEPTGGVLGLNTRLLMRLTFDLPQVAVVPFVDPEPWAVALNVAAETVIPTSQNPPPPDMVSRRCRTVLTELFRRHFLPWSTRSADGISMRLIP
jgi:hypothetical protein